MDNMVIDSILVEQAPCDYCVHSEMCKQYQMACEQYRSYVLGRSWHWGVRRPLKRTYDLIYAEDADEKEEAAERRREARASGEITYMGMVCKNNHSGRRYVAHNACVQCNKANEAKRRAKRKEEQARGEEAHH